MQKERICCTSVYFVRRNSPHLPPLPVRCHVGAEGPGPGGGRSLFWTMLMANTLLLPVWCHVGAGGAQAPERPLTCSGPCSWPTNPAQYDVIVSAEGLGPRRRGRHLFWTMLMATQSAGYSCSSQWGSWTWWMSPSESPTTAKQNTPVILLYRIWLKDLDLLSCSQTFLFLSGGAEMERA